MASSTTPTMVRTRQQEVPLGMVLLGVIFSSILYGVMLTQTHKYSERFKKDPVLVKTLVFAVLLLNTASVFFVGHAAWYYLVAAGPPKVSIWSLNVELALSMLMSGLSETFLAFRVYKFSGNNAWLTAILLALVILHFGSGEVAAIELLLLKKSASFASVKVPTILRLASAAVCDTAIALSLSYFLHTKRTGFKKSDERINYLILFSINSGLLLSATSIGSLITYLVVPKTWVYTALCFLLSRLYATTFLCSLNSRQILFSNDLHDNEKETRIKIKHVFRPQPSTWSVRRSGSPDNKTPTQIFVVTETVTDCPQIMSAAKISNSPNHLKEIMENSSSSSLGRSSSSGSTNTNGGPCI